MPLIFGAMSLFFPAGLTLYISTNSILTLAHHLYMFSDAIGVMLLTHQHYSQFTARPIGDARRDSQMLIALTVDSKDEVNAVIEKGVTAGGRADPNPAQDLGFMFNRHIEDPDGNVWEFLWMNPAAMQ